MAFHTDSHSTVQGIQCQLCWERMAECTLVNFDVTIHGKQPPYAVHAAYRGHTATGEFGEENTQEMWRSYQRALEKSAYLPDAAAIMAAGSRLYHRLMQGPVRDLWITARADLEHERVDGLRMRLALHPTAVAARTVSAPEFRVRSSRSRP